MAGSSFGARALVERVLSPNPSPTIKQTTVQFVKQLLQRDGVRVVAACRSRGPEIDAVAASAPQDRLIVTPLSDVGDEQAVRAWAADLKSKHGVRRVGTAILNAGVYGPRVTIGDVSPEAMIDVFRTNTIGPLLCVRFLREQGLIGGSPASSPEPSLVVAVSSKVGSVADNSSGGGYAYRSSKAALNVSWKSLSIDLAPENVKAVLVHPGWVRSRMTNNQGLIDADQSVQGMLAVLEAGLPHAGGWLDYKCEVVPW